MVKFSCEKCCKEFAQKSHYTQHQKRKTPCINENKIKELISKTVEDKLQQLNITCQLHTDIKSLETPQPPQQPQQPQQPQPQQHPINTATKPALTIETSTFDEIKKYYDETLNTDKSTYKSSNDEPTPIDCISEMISKIPAELWTQPNLSILDPCCGNGNFAIPILFKLLNFHSMKHILENILTFNDINEARLNNVRSVFCNDKYKLQLTNNNYLDDTSTNTNTSTSINTNTSTSINTNTNTNTHTLAKYDLIVANPPYAKILENGKRASKNHNLIKDFIEKALTQLKPNGYLLFITPDNWMSYADRNILIETITQLQIIHLDIHSAKKYFKKIGSSFTWYIIQNCTAYKNINVSGIWKKKEYISSVVSKQRKYIPLLYNQTVHNILSKTVDNITLPKFDVKTSSDLHKYTKAAFISDEKTDIFQYKLIHTPSQTVYASKPHKYQDGYKVFISTTDKYNVFIDC
jgi:SAM-dependent methyltransferase